MLNRSQPGLPGSAGSASPVFGKTPNAGLKSSRTALVIEYIMFSQVSDALFAWLFYSDVGARTVNACLPKTIGFSSYSSVLR